MSINDFAIMWLYYSKHDKNFITIFMQLIIDVHVE